MPQQCLSSPALLLCCCTGAPCMRTLQPNRFHGCPQMPEQLANYVLPAKRAKLPAAGIAPQSCHTKISLSTYQELKAPVNKRGARR